MDYTNASGAGFLEAMGIAESGIDQDANDELLVSPWKTSKLSLEWILPLHFSSAVKISSLPNEGGGVMRTVKLVGACAVLGLLIANQSFAGGHPNIESMGGKAVGDHYSLATYYDEQAQMNKTKAQDWEFAADYYERFPGDFSGKGMSVAEHVAHCRAIAEDFKKAEQQNRELAAKHRALMRKGQGP